MTTTLATRTLRGLPVLILKNSIPGTGSIEIVPVVDEQGFQWAPDQIAEAQGIIGVFLAAQQPPAPPRPCTPVKPKGIRGWLRSLVTPQADPGASCEVRR